jgi:WD and tetratricopeptide repeat-containing protein 1
MGPHAEAKCVAVNPARPEYLAVGANDPFVRVYDRRMLAVGDGAGMNAGVDLPDGCVRYYAPGALLWANVSRLIPTIPRSTPRSPIIGQCP